MESAGEESLRRLLPLRRIKSLRRFLGHCSSCKPLALRVGEHNKSTTVRPLVAVRLCTEAPKWRHAECRPRDAGVIEGRFNRRETAVSVGVSSRELLFNGLVEVAGKHDCCAEKVADEQQQRDSHRSPFHL